ncbi:ATP-binding cassette domain-containing protein [Clavibacter sp. km1a]|uniref:ATP-binding cassette domain-containing protein n=1 Tax=Clavibacter sp. km1a TaxID=3459136 RepID=UPI0040418676
MTDAPDETTSPDATSDIGAQPRDGASDRAASAADAPAATGPEVATDASSTGTPAAVPRPPRPGQRVPRRATAPSPRTAPAVVVSPTPPRVKSSPVVASTVRPGADADTGSEGDATSPRPPRVRRRTRVQRPAGSAEGAVAAGAGVDGGPVAESSESAPAGAVPADAALLADAASASEEEGPAAAEREQGGLEELRDLLADDDDPADGDALEAPVASASPDEGVAHEDVDHEAGATRADDVSGADPVAPEEDATAIHDDDDADRASGEVADDREPASGDAAASVAATTTPEPEPTVEPEPVPVAPARAVTVRTDSLTSPRSTRPGLPGVGETALTPSVRGERAAAPELGDDVLVIEGLTKRFDEKVAVDAIALTVRAGSFYGIVGPNGAGKTTTMSMVTGLLRPDAGTVTVNGIDVWRDPLTAKRSIGVLPDRLRLFDRLTGAQLLHYSGALRGLDDAEIRSRSADLIEAFGIEDAVGRLVTDYSAGMTKKVALACAMIHSPRMLVLDEPFESVDPVSAANVVEILQDYVAHGGTVVLSSHGMDFIQRICDHVAIIVNGRVLASGTMDEVRAGRSLEERFVALAGGRRTAEGFSWLHSFSD